MPRMMNSPAGPQSSTLDHSEIARFSAIAAEWWDPNGKFRPLHRIGPARLAYIRQEMERHFGLSTTGLRVFTGYRILDVGCGGGLIAEPLARLGGTVTAIDPANESIAVARAHAAEQGLAIDYRACRVEELAAQGVTFDVVTCLEVLEHVPDVAGFLATCARLVRPGGLLALSTINRTVKAYALAIVGAEYILRWLPVGTHQWQRFITLDELTRHVTAAGLEAPRFEGLVYDPFRDRWGLGADTDVNYMACAAKPG